MDPSKPSAYKLTLTWIPPLLEVWRQDKVTLFRPLRSWASLSLRIGPRPVIPALPCSPLLPSLRKPGSSFNQTDLWVYSADLILVLKQSFYCRLCFLERRKNILYQGLPAPQRQGDIDVPSGYERGRESARRNHFLAPVQIVVYCIRWFNFVF